MLPLLTDIKESLFSFRKEINISAFLYNKYGTGTGTLSSDHSYTKGIETILSGAEVVLENTKFEYGKVLVLDRLVFYKDNLILVNYPDGAFYDEFGNKIEEESDSYSLTFYYPLNRDCVVNDFAAYIKPRPVRSPEPKAKMGLLFKDAQNRLYFNTYEVDISNVDLGLNYGQDFLKVNDVIQGKLNQNKSGLYIFRGPPGTGKSTYIKYLTSVIKRPVLFIPNNMGHALSDPSLLELLAQHQNCVVVLEDAEKIIVDREINTDSPVSSILNLTDGFIANALNMSIILTFNCDKQYIDKALLRKGRLSFDYEFNKLSIPDAQNVLNSMNINHTAIEPMSLADIFYFNDPVSHADV